MTDKGFKVFWPDDKHFLKEWGALPSQEREKARRIIRAKAAQGHAGRHTAIKRTSGFYYLKLPGRRYRLIYEKDEVKGAIYVRAVVHRDKAYSVRVPHMTPRQK